MENINAKKKVVLIGPAHPLRGGLASYNERLARAFQEAGHSITLFTFSLQYPGFLFPGTTQYSSEPAPTDLDIRVAINSVAPWNWLKIGKAIRQMQPDLVIVRYWLPFMGPCLGTILRLVKKNKHTRIVCIADNIIPHEKRPGDNLFTRYFVKPVDAFITMSEKVLGDMPLFAPQKPARYVPHPLYDNFGEPISVKAARQQLGIDEDSKIVLFFGFIRKYKGLDLLFDAIHRLNVRHPGHPYRFLIAGEFYEDQKPYEEQIDRLQIREQLILHADFIPDSAVKFYLCAADVVIQPYRSATQSGVTPLAYHFEVPMIVTRVGGLPALVPEGKVGLVAEPDADSLADSIEQYFKLGKQHFLPGLREEKKQYRWEVMVEALMGI